MEINGRQQCYAITSLFISLLFVCSFYKLVKLYVILYTNITYKFRFSANDTTKCVKVRNRMYYEQLSKTSMYVRQQYVISNDLLCKVDYFDHEIS